MKIFQFLLFIISDIIGLYNIFHKRYIGLLYPWIIFVIIISLVTALHDSNTLLGIGVLFMIVFMLIQIKKDIYFYLRNDKKLKLKLKQYLFRGILTLLLYFINVIIAFYIIGSSSVEIGWIPRMA